MVTGMKKTQKKDSLRNIKKQLVSWLSIIVIASFAVTAYLGLTYSAHGLAGAADTLYSSTNFRDIQITSNCMLTDDDLSELSSLSCINEIEGVYRLNARLISDITTSHVYISSLTKSIGVPMLTSGNLPTESDQCILEDCLSQKHNLKIGDTLSLKDNYGEKLPELNHEDFVITGTFIHAEHSTFDLDENYCILTTADAFDMERLDNCYSLAEITLKKEDYSGLYDKAYFKYVDECKTEIEKLGDTLSKKRYTEHLAFLQDQILDTEKDLKNAKSQLSLAEKMISSLDGKKGQVMADMSNMLSVIMYEDPSEYKTADKQVSDYYEALHSYENAKKRVSDAKKRYDKLLSNNEGIWYVFNRNSNIDFVNLRTNSENLESLNTTFSMLFVLIAIMVIFASLSRMVQEQRSLIGISKALGMHFREIFSKYFIFGISASLLGIILGIILSATIIEWVIAVGYEDHFVFGRFPYVISLLPTIITVIIALIVAFMSIYLSCNSLLKQTAKKLLSPKVPKGHSKALEKSPILSKLNLYNRMILLNMRSDIVRVCVTIISVAGCCSLTLIGFSLRNSIDGAMARQLTDFTNYDGIVNISTTLSDDAEKETLKILEDHGIKSSNLLHLHGSIQIDDTMEYVEYMISDDLKGLSAFHPLIDFKTGRPMADIPRDGLIISNRLSELYKLKEGDSVSIIDDLGYKHTAKISGIAKNYIGRYVITSKEYYENILNDTFDYNAYFISSPDKTAIETALTTLKETEGFESYSPSSDLTAMFENLMVVLNLIVVLLTVLSGVMAMFVLLNLANMYLLSKRNELVVMRINGFTVTETVQYAIREVIFTTTIGIALGIIFGCAMVYSILRKMEQVHLMFIREPDIPACIIAAIVTALFTAGIYALSMRKVKALSFSDL